MLAHLGYKVYSLDLHVSEELSVERKVVQIRTNVTKKEDLNNVCETIRYQNETISAIVNCAGILEVPMEPQDIEFSDWDKVISVDLSSVFYVCNSFKPLLASDSSCIVNIASIAGMSSMPLHAYSTAKSAVIMLTRNLAAAWGMENVRVNSVSPGFTLTPAMQAQVENGHRDLSLLEKHSAMGRLVQIDEIVNVVQFLISDLSSAITGANIPVDCGWVQKSTWVSHEQKF